MWHLELWKLLCNPKRTPGEPQKLTKFPPWYEWFHFEPFAFLLNKQSMFLWFKTLLAGLSISWRWMTSEWIQSQPKGVKHTLLASGYLVLPLSEHTKPRQWGSSIDRVFLLHYLLEKRGPFIELINNYNNKWLFQYLNQKYSVSLPSFQIVHAISFLIKQTQTSWWCTFQWQGTYQLISFRSPNVWQAICFRNWYALLIFASCLYS